MQLKYKKKKNYSKGDQILEQVTRRGFKVSIPGHIQNPIGQVPEQPALADPALSRGMD